MEITQKADFSVTFNQSRYIDDLVNKFLDTGSDLFITCDTPCLPDNFRNLAKAVDETERVAMRKLPYLELVGSLLYISTMSRPDVAYHLSVLCRFMSDPSPDCYTQAIGVLLFLHKTKSLHIEYKHDYTIQPALTPKHSSIRRNMGFHALSDSSWGVPNPSYGFVLTMAGGPISWVSKACKSALSSCEAEYTAASNATRDIEFVRNVLEDIGYPIYGRLVLGVDNTAAIDVANNPGVSARNKHFDRETHYIRTQVDEQKIDLVHLRTEYQTGDLFTKPLDKTTFIRHQSSLLKR